MAENEDNGSPASKITLKQTGLPISSTAALEFEEFSFTGPNGSISSKHVQHEHVVAFGHYLLENYDAQVQDTLGMFLALYCGEDMPPEGERPFSIAGYITIWKTLADLDDGYDFWPCFGEDGCAPAEPPSFPGALLYLELDSSILSQNEGGGISNQLLLQLADKVFKDCEAISVLGDKLVIELPEVSHKDFVKCLKTLPRAIKNLPVGLEFHNGPLQNTPTRSSALKALPRSSQVAENQDYLMGCLRYQTVQINNI
ncbi:unnamed protein product [Clonostachys rosea]|uniref:Uncharacterized protein n=1 Tax=Bionectria ochroleuca TaxID=29856 RepID=A0ABY6TS94_BIOOC|nr:unnamed protein product [Clonostachys rosea]